MKKYTHSVWKKWPGSVDLDIFTHNEIVGQHKAECLELLATVTADKDPALRKRLRVASTRTRIPISNEKAQQLILK
jgi:hypothetical protein